MIRFEAGLLAEDLSKDLHSWCWVVGGQLLRSHCLTGLEAGLLPHGIQIATQFFPLKKGDLVLLKDPQVGGPGRDRLALVQCFREQQNGQPGVFMASGFYAPTTLGMKLPPIPLRVNGEINEAVMAALGPCEPRLRKEISSQDRIRDLAMKKAFQNLWTEKAVAEETSREKRDMKEKISELPEGEISAELSCGNELIRVRLEVEDAQINFNFTGTSAGNVHALPLAATSGIVRSTVREWLGWPRALSAACASQISMSTPTGCMLNAPAKNSCEDKLGTSASLLKAAVEAALHRWDRRVNRGLTNYFDAKAILQFADRAPFSISIPSGSAATEASEGLSFFDQRALGMGFSPEKLEASCPVLVEQVDERKETSTKEKSSGGPGLVLSFRVLEPGKLFWENPPVYRITGKKEQGALQTPEIEILRQGKAVTGSDDGSFALEKNDVVTMKSGSGGGLL